MTRSRCLPTHASKTSSYARTHDQKQNQSALEALTATHCAVADAGGIIEPLATPGDRRSPCS